MRIFNFVRFAVVFVVVGMSLTACTPPPNVVIKFDDSHQLFLERTLGKLDITETVLGVVPAGSSVCVVSMETEKTSDNPMVSMIEDNLLSQFLSAGFTVLERDDDLIRRIIQESSGDTFQYTFFPGRVVVEGQSAAAYGSQWGYGLSGSAGSTVIEGAGADSVLAVSTRMKAADYIVSYRILECGLVYRKADNAKMKKREAQVRLHVRVHDAGTGAVLLAKNVEVRDEDLIDKNAANWLLNYHYTFFGADYPRQNGNSPGIRNVTGKSGVASNPSQTPR